jgi:hypothetical protein
MDDTIQTNDDNFFLVKIGDFEGITAHGPYSEETAIEKRGKDEQIISRTRLERMLNPEDVVEPVSKIPPVEPGAIHAKMVADIRQWGRALLFLGVIHLVTGGFLNSSWGVILILEGLLSFLFQTSSMYVIYGIVLGWAAISNVIGGQVGWVFFALFQLFLVVQIFRSYVQYRRAEIQVAELTAEEASNKKKLTAAFLFPWSGCVIGVLSLVILVGSFASLFVMGALGYFSYNESLFDFMLNLAMELGVFAFSLSLASLLSSYRYKVASIGGLIVGILTVLIMLVLMFLT